jgi:hypothetical protein
VDATYEPPNTNPAFGFRAAREACLSPGVKTVFKDPLGNWFSMSQPKNH